MKSQRITRHRYKLSAYMDGQLSARQTTRLEKRLVRDSGLRAEYEDLLRTRSLLRSLRPRRVPRNFTLTPDMVRTPRRRKSGFLVPALRFSSSAAALVLVLTFAVELIGGLAPRMAMKAQEAAPEMVMEAPAEEATPMILLWDADPGVSGGMAPEAEGMGSGPLGEQSMNAEPQANAADVAEALPMMEEAAPEEEALRATQPDEPQAEMEMEAPAAAPAEEMPLPAPTAATLAPAEVEEPLTEESAAAEKAVTEDENVILGIAPEEEQGHIQETDTYVAAEAPAQRGRLSSQRWLQIGLGAFALITGLISFLLPRKRRA